MHTHRLAYNYRDRPDERSDPPLRSARRRPNSLLPRTVDGKLQPRRYLAGHHHCGSRSSGSRRGPQHAGQRGVHGSCRQGDSVYQPWAAAKRKLRILEIRQKADPLNQCYLPGTPRIMYMEYPFQIFQTPQAVALTFEWSLVHRLIYTDGTQHPADIDTWMGDSRGHWDGDTLVVDVARYNDKTWFDIAGDFHSDALHVVERYRMTGPDTIQYEATVEDSKVFTKPWTISIPLHRRADLGFRHFEYNCQDDVEEANGAFTREPKTWFPGDGTFPPVTAKAAPVVPATPPAVVAK